jgi:hypothetical protein
LTYRSKPSQYRPGSLAFPVWYSYAEAVLHGFLAAFPTGGVEAFIASTGGGTVPIVDDRAAPLYRRARITPPSGA